MNTKLIAFPDGSNFMDIEDFSLLSTSVMPVVHVHSDGRVIPCGTCFAINSTGLFITALHVVQNNLWDSNSKEWIIREDNGFTAILYQSNDLNDDGSGHYVGGLVSIGKIYLCEEFDIALLHANLPIHQETGLPPPVRAQRLGTSLPEIGELCFAFGYHSMTWTKGDVSDSLYVPISCSKGIVEDIHIPRRDRSMLPFPCFRMNLELPSGMSGGPVLDSKGIVRGVVCSSFTGDKGEPHTSYATLAGLAALIKLTFEDHDGSSKKGFLWDLMKAGAVPADFNIECFTRDSECLNWALGGGTISHCYTSD